MKKIRLFWRENAGLLLPFILTFTAVAGLLLYRLGSLTGGMSANEIEAVTQPYGFSGIWNDVLFLPLDVLRSLIFFAFPDHGQLISRLPNVLLGGLSILNFGWLIWLWHGRRTALFATTLFATSSWTLHVSRLASNDVVYLWAITALLLIQVLLYNYRNSSLAWYFALVNWLLIVFIPGMIWIVLAQIILQRKLISEAFANIKNIRNVAVSTIGLVISLALLIAGLFKSGGFISWLGLPNDLASPLTLLKQFAGVFVHLFIRGPQYPELWLGRAPLLDIFALIACGVGLYFYATRWKAARSRTIGIMFALGVILVALHGPVSFSILVPLLFVAVAAGLAYLLHEWLKVFPLNPLARGIGIGLVAAAVILSVTYNTRAYFVAWPHNETTPPTFRHRL